MKKYKEVLIGGTTYEFSNEIGNQIELFNSFNNLAKSTFGISFDTVGENYEPYVLSLEGEVCANVSVSQLVFYYNGKKRFYIQLGTVMTKPEFRRKGLSRWLLEYILKEWEQSCDAIYLFANDSVHDFYRKFDFIETREYQFKSDRINPSKTKVSKLQMDHKKDIDLLFEKYMQGNSFSKFYFAENKGLLSFYCLGFMKENVYYSKEYDVVIVAEVEDEKVCCYDIFGATEASLENILSELLGDKPTEIYLGFTPKKAEGLIVQNYSEEDTTLFILAKSECLFSTEKLMFPLLSHA